MNDKEQLEKILKQFETLSPDVRRTVCLIVENLDFIEQLAKEYKIPESEMEKYIENALSRKNYVLLAILLCKQKKEQ